MPSITYAGNLGDPLFVPNPPSTISTTILNTSSINFNAANQSTVSFGLHDTGNSLVLAPTFNNAYTTLGAECFVFPGATPAASICTSGGDIVFSTTQAVFPQGGMGLGGGEYISTIGNQLFYYNGSFLEPISQLSSISTLEEWAYYPAISTVNMDGFDITNADVITASTVNASTIFTNSLFATSTIQSFTFFSTNVAVGSAAYTSSLQFTTNPAPTVLTNDAIGQLLVNGLPITTGGGGNAANWSIYPAISTVQMSGYDISGANDIRASGLTARVLFDPILQHRVVAESIELHDTNPLLPMRIEGDSGIVITAPSDDINITAGDVNINSTDLTSVLNITSVGPTVIAAGVGMDLTAGAAMLVNAVGPITVGSAVYTEVEDFNFNDDTLSKGAANDLNLNNIGTILNPTGPMTVSTTAAALNLVGGVGLNATAGLGAVQISALAGSASMGATATATVQGGTGVSLTATTGNANIFALSGSTLTQASGLAGIHGVGAVNISSSVGYVNMEAATTMNLGAIQTMTQTASTITHVATGGPMILSTTGANDIDVYPGTSGGFHIFSQNGNPAGNPELKIENQNGNDKGAYVKLYKKSASPANNDQIGVLSFHGNNSSGVDTEMAEIEVFSQTVAAGSETGYINMNVQNSGLGLITSLQVLDNGVKPLAIYDSTNTRGVSGQVLTTTGTGISWINASDTNATGITATGGDFISSFVESGQRYTYHIFSTPSVSSVFTITSLGNTPSNASLDICLLGGGGSGGGGVAGIQGGGGGAGSLLLAYDFPLFGRSNISPFTDINPPYTFDLTVGAGGNAATNSVGSNGTDTTLFFPQALAYNWVAPTGGRLVMRAGGGGGGGTTVGASAGNIGYAAYAFGANASLTESRGSSGGTGGGTGANTTLAASAYLYSGPNGGVYGETLTVGGHRGSAGSASGTNSGGGGGGARTSAIGVGLGGWSVSTCSVGGMGARVQFDGTTRFLGGGGEAAGVSRASAVQSGNMFGGGLGYTTINSTVATSATANTGGGGGGATAGTASGAGGSGLVMIRYKS